jgi:hypothetical protein
VNPPAPAGVPNVGAAGAPPNDGVGVPPNAGLAAGLPNEGVGAVAAPKLNVGFGISFCGAPNPPLTAGAPVLAPNWMAGPCESEAEKSKPDAGFAGWANMLFSVGLGAAPKPLPLLVDVTVPPNTLLLVVAPKTEPEDVVAAPNENPVLAVDAAGAVAAPKLKPPAAGFAAGAPKIDACVVAAVANGLGADAPEEPNPPVAGAVDAPNENPVLALEAGAAGAPKMFWVGSGADGVTEGVAPNIEGCEEVVVAPNMFVVGATDAVGAAVCPKIEAPVPAALNVEDVEEVEGTLEAPKLNPVEGAAAAGAAENEKPPAVVPPSAGAEAVAPNIEGAGAAGAALGAGWLNEGGAADVPNENDGTAAAVELPNIDGNVDAVVVDAAPKSDGAVEAAAGAVVVVVAPKSDGCCCAGWLDVVAAAPNMEGAGAAVGAADEVVPNENIDGRAGTAAAAGTEDTVVGAGTATDVVASGFTALKKDEAPSDWGTAGAADEFCVKLNVGAGRLVWGAEATGFVTGTENFGWNPKLNEGAAAATGAAAGATAGVAAGGAAGGANVVVVVDAVDGCIAMEKDICVLGAAGCAAGCAGVDAGTCAAGVNCSGGCLGTSAAALAKPKLKPVAAGATEVVVACVVATDALGAVEPTLSEDGPKLKAGTTATGAAAEAADTAGGGSVGVVNDFGSVVTDAAKLFNIFKPVKTLVLATDVSVFVVTEEEVNEVLAEASLAVELPNENPDVDGATAEELENNEAVGLESVDELEPPNKLTATLLLVLVVVVADESVVVVAVVVPSVSLNKLFTRLIDSSWFKRNAFNETPDSPNSSWCCCTSSISIFAVK